MEPLLAVVAGILFAIAAYLLTRRSIVKMVIGLVVLGNAANLTLFTMGGLTRGASAIIPYPETAPVGDYANPLPQALVLTAIVIGFGMLAFALVLAYRSWQELDTLDPDGMRVAEPIATEEDK
ncbi:MAG: cation:proton antiporter [Deltaproteobacteria bacterium]|nr:MAG: cation:proton antiporter [Deltaproteobacteria bacterium]